MRIKKPKIALIDDWKKAYKLASVWLSVIVGAVAAAEPLVPSFRDILPPNWIPYAIAAIALARILKFGEDKK